MARWCIFLDWIWRTNMSQGTLEHNWIHAKIKSNSCFRFKCWFQFRFVCKKSSSRYMPSSPWQVILGGKSLTGQFNIENCWFNSVEAWMNAFNVSNFGSLVRNAFVRKTHINERNWNFFAIYTKEYVVSGEIYTAGKNFILPPVVTAVTNLTWAKVTKRVSCVFNVINPFSED